MAVESHDKKLDDLLKMVEEGKAQLPDFQRSWVWDDTKICKLIESITSGFPMGAAMFLANGGEHIRFKYRTFEGVDSISEVTPEWLVLDGQQRLTTLYQVLKSKKATNTRLETNRDTIIKRYYYLDIRKCLDSTADRLEAIIIQLDKETPKEAVCQIFENVNTGGVPLTVFELVTATFAAEGHELRKDWETIRHIFAQKVNGELLKEITGANFLAAMTLLVSYYKRVVSGDDERVAVTCKKKDILRLELKDYLKYHDALIKGFCDAADFLVHQGIFRSRDLPYSSQLIPLAAIFAYDNENKKMLHLGSKQELLSRWYWCGVMGELYGGANEARFATDIMGVFRWMEGGEMPETVYRSNIQPTRLLTMQTRNSAAYKGVMALILQDSPLDFMTGHRMDIASYIDEDADIHHIFPQTYCEKNNLPRIKWNSVINKTPIYASSNRSIGGHAPSTYIGTMANKGLKQVEIQEAIESHKVSYAHLALDDFNAYFIDRAKQLLDRIEQATGKSVSGRDSEETIREFGVALI